jgi:hypothetical protein
MKSLVRKLGPLLLAFLLGVAAKGIWDHRQQIREFLANPFIYYQD